MSTSKQCMDVLNASNGEYHVNVVMDNTSYDKWGNYGTVDVKNASNK